MEKLTITVRDKKIIKKLIEFKEEKKIKTYTSVLKALLEQKEEITRLKGEIINLRFKMGKF